MKTLKEVRNKNPNFVKDILKSLSRIDAIAFDLRNDKGRGKLQLDKMGRTLENERKFIVNLLKKID